MQIDYTKKELTIIAAILEMKLLDESVYLKWCYQLIEAMDQPEEWMIDVGFSKNSTEAVQAINCYIYGEPFEEIPNRSDLTIAGLFVKYKLNQMDWASFLLESGFLSDSQEGKVACEYFFTKSTSYEENPSYLKKRKEEKEILTLYEKEISQVIKYYTILKQYVESDAK